MAKKGQQEIFALKCSVCNRRNYITNKNKTNTPGKLVIKKYCPTCRKHTEHKETSKLK